MEHPSCLAPQCPEGSWVEETNRKGPPILCMTGGQACGGHPALPRPPLPAQAKAPVSPSVFPLPPGPFLKGAGRKKALPTPQGQMSRQGARVKTTA